jgi:Zn-finger nucleic acid-binding protein
MLCPTCKKPLTMSERQGIEIDYCPSCRGVWLDRGELDKIIERSAPVAPAVQHPAPQPQPGFAAQPHGFGHYKHKRRKSFLEELFD